MKFKAKVKWEWQFELPQETTWEGESPKTWEAAGQAAEAFSIENPPGDDTPEWVTNPNAFVAVSNVDYPDLNARYYLVSNLYPRGHLSKQMRVQELFAPEEASVQPNV